MPTRRQALVAVAAPLFAALAFLAVPPAHHAAVAAEKKAAAAATFEVYQDKGGEYRWRLRAANSQILAIAPDGYKEKRGCLSAIESVKRDVQNAPVEVQDAKP